MASINQNKNEILLFIRDNAVKLNFNLKSTSQACYLLHQSFELSENINSHILAMSCLYLAGKVEEEGVKLKDVLNACNQTLYVTNKDYYMETLGPNHFFNLVDSVSYCEYLVMRKNGFRTAYPNPHNYLSSFLKVITDWIPSDAIETTHIYVTAFSLLQDSYMSKNVITLIGNNPSLFALSVLYLTFKLLNINIPLINNTIPPSNSVSNDEIEENKSINHEWWKFFISDSAESELILIAETILKNIYIN